MKYTVIYYFEGKNKEDCRQEEYRYKRFLGPEVSYTALSFEDFPPIRWLSFDSGEIWNRRDFIGSRCTIDAHENPLLHEKRAGINPQSVV
jgi:hypothetical protein